ncbi:LTA synthase family protein [Pseudidiomarina woesei]|uniref:Phosphoglycerol transferase MdoB or a related enzyme of AlkP superfamily n=1 Tax=Pseudidiomarina woesei TaxID=1381080 RepID=A0A0K6H3D9_9GAMM|nr:LTA synthase family protein [Pseudidiomarina woesei]CUA85244.1 Phosphoglycerol transferase MdoB or a related enzyme of AlkP superfamily [Pseudidiomarina woesei]
MKFFRPFFLFYSTSLIGLGLFRILYFILYNERVQAVTSLPVYLMTGIRADIIVLGYFALIALMTLPVFALFKAERAWYKASTVWFAIIGLLIIFMEFATPAFIAQYDTRPNRLFFEYLAYPQEVFATLWNGFRGWFIASVGATGIAIIGIRQHTKRQLRTAPNQRMPWQAWVAWPLILFMVFVGVRSTVSHRPANPAFFATTADPLINSLFINSTYSLLYAVYNLKHESKANLVYSNQAEHEIIQTVLNEPHLAQQQYTQPNYPTVHFQPASVQREKPLNVVIILEESLGATFVESLGGLPLTPNLERLKQHGWWFERLYATGVRSVRGIEAVVAGFLPTRARSTVKLSNSQRDFFTIAEFLQRQNYTTEFIYGGEAHFDNMATFFAGNGFTSIIDQRHYENPKFVGSWGVSDDDVFGRLHERLQTAQQNPEQPYFALAFSSSNHEPFEFPDNTIELAEQPKQTLNNAVKYADYALGKFFDKAMASDYWHNTIFLVVADHDTRVYGNELVPVNKFHIPGLILGADIQPKRLTAIASQIDLLPTLVSLAGVSGELPVLGQDLSAETPAANRAMMQFGDNFGWLEDHELTVLTVDGKAMRYSYQPAQHRLTPLNEPLSQAELTRIRAHAAIPSVLYQQRLYHVPQP